MAMNHLDFANPKYVPMLFRQILYQPFVLGLVQLAFVILGFDEIDLTGSMSGVVFVVFAETYDREDYDDDHDDTEYDHEHTKHLIFHRALCDYNTMGRSDVSFLIFRNNS